MEWQILVAIGLVVLSGGWMLWSVIRPFFDRHGKGCGDGGNKDELLQIAAADKPHSLD